MYSNINLTTANVTRMSTLSKCNLSLQPSYTLSFQWPTRQDDRLLVSALTCRCTHTLPYQLLLTCLPCMYLRNTPLSSVPAQTSPGFLLAAQILNQHYRRHPHQQNGQPFLAKHVHLEHSSHEAASAQKKNDGALQHYINMLLTFWSVFSVVAQIVHSQSDWQPAATCTVMNDRSGSDSLTAVQHQATTQPTVQTTL